jgi:hypothetical protein
MGNWIIAVGTPVLDEFQVIPYAIEIRQGDAVLFRQDRDGGVYVNAFQQESVAETVVSLESPSDPECQMTDPWIESEEEIDLDKIMQTAQAL